MTRHLQYTERDEYSCAVQKTDIIKMGRKDGFIKNRRWTKRGIPDASSCATKMKNC